MKYEYGVRMLIYEDDLTFCSINSEAELTSEASANFKFFICQ